MKEEQFEPIDLRMRQAAEHVEPEFDEVAWQRMEMLLDKRKNRRMPFIFWWLTDVLMLGATLLLVVGGPRDMGKFSSENKSGKDNLVLNKKATNTAADKTTISSNQQENNLEQKRANRLNEINVAIDETQLPIDANINKEINQKKGKSGSAFIQNNTNKQYVSTVNKHNSNSKSVENKLAVAAPYNAAEITASGIQQLEKDSSHNSERNKVIPPSNNVLETEVEPVNNKDSINLANENIAINSTETDIKNLNNQVKNSENKFIKSLYIFGAAMPGLSFVSGTKPGPITTNIGGGIGLVFAKKWSVQAGAFLGPAVYTAGPNDYKIKPGSYYAYWDIRSVDADCKLIQIPLQLQYNFLQKKNTTLFVSGGFVTMIMQKEKYEYYYYRNGNPYNYTHTYTSGNVEWFSHLTLSAGIKQTFGKKLSINAGAYYNLPLQGVGEGSIKLHSFGLQFGVDYNLFHFKK